MNEQITALEVPLDVLQLKPEATIIDVTAGNRIMWDHLPNRDSKHIIFIDKEPSLWKKPDLLCDHRFLPFRDNSFQLVIFDPVWYINAPPWFENPQKRTSTTGSFFGHSFKTRRGLIRYIYECQKEFARVAPRMCMKWGERDVSLWNILGVLKDNWRAVHIKNHKSPKHTGFSGSAQSSNNTYWVTLERQSTYCTKGEIEK